MFYVISYDIADDKRRRRVAKAMEDFGVRVQWSVFDCILNDRDILELQHRLANCIDFEKDSLRFYRLCERCRVGVEVVGRGTLQEARRVQIL